jgi:hypothetical protein
MRVNFGVHLSACRQPGLSDTPDDPGTYLLYTISGVSTQYLSKKRPACGSGSSLKGTNKKQQKQQKALAVHCEIAAPPTYHLIRVS